MASKLVAPLLEANARFASTYKAPPPLNKMRQMWSSKGVKGVTVLSCSDPRVIPEKFLELESAPKAVIRNAGGRAMDAMRSIQVLNALNEIELILVIHHTDCGTTHVSDAEVRENIKQKYGLSTDDVKFGEIKDLEASIVEDVEMIKNDPMFGGKAPAVAGLLYDVETGKLKEVVPA